MNVFDLSERGLRGVTPAQTNFITYINESNTVVTSELGHVALLAFCARFQAFQWCRSLLRCRTGITVGYLLGL